MYIKIVLVGTLFYSYGVVMDLKLGLSFCHVGVFGITIVYLPA